MRQGSLRFSFALACVLAACGGGGGGEECGNDEMEGAEECDDGNTDNGDGCDRLCVVERAPTAYRVDSLFLRDPHLWAFETFDIVTNVNDAIAENITTDGDDPADGILDLSLVFVLKPPRPAGPASLADAVIGAECAAPVETTSCSVGTGTTVLPTTATNSDEVCLTPIAGTTNSEYEPAVGPPPGRCFVTDTEDSVTLDFGGVLLAMQDVRVAATYAAGDPPAMLTDGLFIGYITEETANNTFLPEDLPLVGGDSLASVLLDEDMDMGPNGEMGWYFYLNFTAIPVPYTE